GGNGRSLALLVLTRKSAALLRAQPHLKGESLSDQRWNREPGFRPFWSAWLSVHAKMHADGGEGLQQNPDIEAAALVLEVVHVEHQPAGEAQFATHGDLPVARDAGFDGEQALGIDAVVNNLRRCDRPGSDQAHVTTQDVPELRQFIQLGPAHEPS